VRSDLVNGAGGVCADSDSADRVQGRLAMKRVLVVDDHEENLYLSQALLQSQGFDVDLARNGAEALSKARETPPDLIISDVLMPIMDGFALCRGCKADEHLCTIPFVFHTATYTDEKDSQLAAAIGADAFITKPVEPEDFMAEIRAVLSRPESAQSPAPREPDIPDADFAREHSEALIRMVEQKIQQVEKVNRALEQEIAGRKQTEASLQESERRFRGLFETMSQGVVYMDANGRAVLANPAAERIMGISQDEMLGKTALDSHWESKREDGSVLPYEEQPAVLTLRTGEPVSGTIMGVYNRKLDEQRWIEVDTIPQLLPGETAPSGVFGTFTDITQRKLAEDRLRRQLSFNDLLGGFLSRVASASATEIDDDVASTLRPIADFVGIDSAIILQVSDDSSTWGTTHSWAAASIQSIAPALVGMPMGSLPWIEHQVLNENTLVLRSWDDIPPQADDMRQLWEQQKLKSALMVPLHGRGTPVMGCLALLSVVNELQWGPQEVRQMEQLGEAIAIALERKRAEENLRASDEQLRQSQKMEAIGQLAGGIAHDFNNLLTAIIGYSDLLLSRQELGDSTAYRDITEIRRAAERAGALTGQILAFSRRQTLQPTVVSLNDVLADMEPLLRHALGEDIELASDLHPALYHTEVDVHQFEQVLMNLVINARDAMTSGGRLTIATANTVLDEEYCRIHPWAVPGSYVMLSVSDTGVGMDEATLARMFEPFFTTKEKGKGTGLGLSTVYGIVKQSGGSISVESQPGSGSTFTIYLPPTKASMQPESPPTPGAASNRGNETILVVEDEAALRSLISRALGSLGYTTHVVGTADEALSQLKDAGRPLDLMLTDMVLPGVLQGHDLAAQAKVLRPDMPVVYMSGYASDSILPGGRIDPGINYLEKPFGPADLGRRLREVLDAANA
jgi:two-component system cell cycle sensor histidine kinase/response regulator CckA